MTVPVSMMLLVLPPPSGAANPTAPQNRAEAHDTPSRLCGSFALAAAFGLGAVVAADQAFPFQFSTRALVGRASFAQKYPTPVQRAADRQDTSLISPYLGPRTAALDQVLPFQVSASGRLTDLASR